MRPSVRQLAYKLFMASRLIHRDRYYRHQSSGGVYKIVGYAIEESTGHELVLYRPAAVNRSKNEKVGAMERPEVECIFSRPLNEFEEQIEWHDGEMLRKGPRFKLVNKVEKWVDA